MIKSFIIDLLTVILLTLVGTELVGFTMGELYGFTLGLFGIIVGWPAFILIPLYIQYIRKNKK